MTILLKSTFLLLGLLGLASCGGRKDIQKTSTRINLIQASVTGDPLMNGGVLIMGKKHDGTDSFRYGIRGDTVEKSVNLNNGTWSLYAIAWEGDTNVSGDTTLTGTTRCAERIGLELAGEDVTVDLSLGTAKCLTQSEPFDNVSDTAFMETDQFAQVKFRSCSSYSAPATSTACTSGAGNLGLSGSFIVEIQGGLESTGTELPGLKSRCVTIAEQDAGNESSYIRLPVGNAQGAATTIGVFSYTSADCTGTPSKYIMDDGPIVGLKLPNQTVVLDNGAGVHFNATDGYQLLMLFDHNLNTPGTNYTGPLPPNSLALNTPATSPNTNSSPTIDVSGVTSGATVQLYSDATCSTLEGSTTAAGTTATIALSTLSDGTFTFYALQIDGGVTSPCSSASVTYVLDTTAPAASTTLGWIETNPSNTSLVNALWTPSVDGDVVTQDITYYTDSCLTPEGTTGSMSPGQTSHAFTGSNGVSYFYDITSTDSAGNSTVSACSAIIDIDLTAPTAPTALTWAETSPHNTNTITPNWTLSVSGDVASQTIVYYIDAGCTVAEGTSNALSSVAIADSFTPGDGTYYYTVTATDSAGNSTATACSPAMIIDTTAPTPASGLGWSETSPINTTSVNASWTVSGSPDVASQTVTYFTDAICTSAEGTNSALGSAATTHAFVGANAFSYYYNITTFDNAGNNTVSDCSPVISIDTTAPVNPTALTWLEVSPHNATNITASWTLSVSGDVVSQDIAYYTDPSCTAAQGTSASLGPSTVNNAFVGADGGNYYFKITATDAAGNISSPICSPVMWVDTTPPTVASGLSWVQSSPTNTIPVTPQWTLGGSPDVASQTVDYYTDAGCTTIQGTSNVLASGATTDSFSPSDGLYYFRVRTTDTADNSNDSGCSPAMTIDSLAPTDNTANPQFTDAFDIDGNLIAVTWTAFTDTNLSNHRLYTYTNSACSAGEVIHGLTASTTNSNSTVINGLSDGQFWGRVAAIDAAGNETLSACSTDSIIVDSTPPTDNTANLQFTNAFDNDGNLIAVTWTAFTDTNLSDHQLYTFTNAACSTGETNHGLTSSTAPNNSTIIDGLSDGTYWARVRAIDGAGNSTLSACSTDSIIVDATAPTDNTANLQFTDAFDADGNNVAVTWTAFTDTNLSNHRLYTYTNSACSAGEVNHGLTGSSTNSNSTIIFGLADGTYYGKVQAIDTAGNVTLSACSTDSIIIDSTPPTDNTANPQFTDVYDGDGNDVQLTWTAFTDANLTNHKIYTFTDSGCSGGMVDHGTTASTATNDNLIIDGLTDGQYWVKVEAHDIAGNTTMSSCSTDSVTIDTIPPTDNGANPNFIELHDADGLAIDVYWVPFTDNMSIVDHYLTTYTDAGCTVGAEQHPNSGSPNNLAQTHASVPLTDFTTYYVNVKAVDGAGNETTSACSTIPIVVNSSFTPDWVATTITAAPGQTYDHSATWTGSKMCVWGGSGASNNSCYDPIADSWSPITITGQPSNRTSFPSAWLASVAKMCIWGGNSGGTYLGNGGCYDPVSNSWMTMTATGAPTARYTHTAIDAGGKLCVWGGRTANTPIFSNDGGCWDPLLNSWSPITTVNAPAAREGHTAVWVSNKMCVWGGQNTSGVGYNDGGCFDPSAENWTAISLTGAPSARASHTAAVVGSLMCIIGGGINGSSTATDGGCYNTESNSWTSMDMTGAPTQTHRAIAASAGSKMCIWGGWSISGSASTNLGGCYSPHLNNWDPITTVGAPSERQYHKGVFTDKSLCLFGGATDHPPSIALNTGGCFLFAP